MNKLFFLILLCVLPAHSFAQETGGLGNNETPVEISADQTLEWLQKEKQYVARGAVEAKQGDIIITTEKLVADYRDDNQGGNAEIYKLTATDNVTIKNTDSTITGDNAVYNVDTGVAIITGKNLKLTTPDQIITANERMEYNTGTGLAKAIGNAKIIRGPDTLSANSITANFKKDGTGKQTLTTASASGNVTITTPDEVLTGNNGTYNAQKNTAEITGNVQITRGPNQLEGARAQVDLNTNISKMYGAPESGKRVQGIFFPGSQKAP